jgi:putative ATPase
MKPLPDQIRPQILSEVIGQAHLLGEGGSLKRLIDSGHLPSLIFWGPPGVGKTTLAYILARHFDYEFIELSGVDFSIKQLEAYKPSARSRPKASEQANLFGNSATSSKSGAEPVVIFIDEIHRLNKSQQAQFLPYVERGDWILIGATTENPSFEVISPLLSRAQVLVLKPFSDDEAQQILDRGISYLQKANPDFDLNPAVQDYLIRISNGDGRLLLNGLMMLANLYPVGELDLEEAKRGLGNLHLVYDKGGEQHFDTISALHKSMRGSDPDASVYYLGRMLEGGEDPLYVARRCVRFASEDIGNADPQAVILANSIFEVVQKIGMPEANVALAQLVIYLARAPKSVEAYAAYGKVREDIFKHGNLAIPLKIRNSPTKLMKDLGYGKDYKYAPDFAAEELEGETYLPEGLEGKKYVGK